MEMRICSRCRIEKPLEEYHRRTEVKMSGSVEKKHQRMCKPCMIFVNKRYQARRKALKGMKRA